MAKAIRSIAILTGGGDCPGLNAVIRAITKSAISKHGLTVWGIEDGFLGLIEQKLRPLHFDDVSNILTLGGTILGTSNVADPFKFQVKSAGGETECKDVSDACVQTLKERHIDALICIGGDGTMTCAAAFAKKGVTVIGVPKTIDNDLRGTDVTFGFNTAVHIATEALDRLHSTASSHHRVMVVEVMGRYAGWIALHAGVASGSDCILIPEIHYNLDNLCQYVLHRGQKGKRFSIIVVSEGAKELGGEMVVKKVVKNSPDPIRLGGVANIIADQIQERTNLESRAVTLGHIQRGGSPTQFDRVLGTNFGFSAIELLLSGRKNCMVAVKDGNFSSVPLSQVAGKIKNVPRNHTLIRAAKAINTCFGN